MRRVPGPSYAGSEVDESKKLVGHYDKYNAVLVHGGMTIEYHLLGSRRAQMTVNLPILNITCDGPEFKALESFPETICGKKKYGRKKSRKKVKRECVGRGEREKCKMKGGKRVDFIICKDK